MTNKTNNTATASVFVTTYAVGNETGFANGKWFDLTDYSDIDDFIGAATEYANKVLGDSDPELCFSDYESSFHSLELISECGISSQVWELFELEDYEFEKVCAYISWQGLHHADDIQDILNKAEDCYIGQYDNDEDYAYQYMKETGGLEGLPPMIENNIDWAGVATWLMEGVAEVDGYYFRNC